MSFDLGELSISLNLNTGSFHRDLDKVEQRVASFGGRRIYVQLDLEDKGTQALSNFQNQIVATQRFFNQNPLRVRADHFELKGLNEHIEAKRTHVKDVQKWLDQNPLTVQTRHEHLPQKNSRPQQNDDSGQIRQGNAQAITQARPAHAEPSSASFLAQNLEFNSPQIQSQLKLIIEELKKGRGASKPSIGSSFIQGAGIASGSGISKFLGNKISAEITPLIGSFELLDRRVTESLKNKLSSQLEKIPGGIKQPLDLLKTGLEAAVKEFLGEFDLAVETKSKLNQQQKSTAKKTDSAREGAKVEVKQLGQNRFDLLSGLKSSKQESAQIAKRVQAISQILANDTDLSDTDLKLYSQKLEEFEKRSQELNLEIKAKQKALAKNAKALEKARSASATLKPDTVEKTYLDLIRELNQGKLPQQRNIPKLSVNEELLKSKEGSAAYLPEANTIVVDAQIANAVKEGRLTAKQINVLLHEIQHALDVDFGSLQRLDALDRGEMLTKPLIPTQAEIQDLIPFVAQYKPEDRPAEMNAELSARRKTPQVNEKMRRKELTNDLFNVVGFGGIDFVSQVNANAAKLKSILSQTNLIEESAQKAGITYKPIVENITNTVNNLESQAESIAQILASVATGEVDSAEILAAQKKVIAQIKSMRTFLSTFDEFKQTAITEISQVRKTGDRKAKGLVGKPLPSKAEQLGSSLAKTTSELIKPENIQQVNIALAKTGQVALNASKFIALATLDVFKFSYGVAKAGESLAFNFIPGAPQLKRITQVGVPLIGAGMAASAIPGLLPAVGEVAGLASGGSQALLAPAIDAIASGVGGAIASSLSALPFGGGAIAGGAAETMALGAGNVIAGALPAVAGLGMAAKATSSALDVAKTQIEQVTGTNKQAIAAGENLANGLFKLGGQVRSFSETLAVQKQKASQLRQQLPSAQEFKALPAAERVQKATSIARIAAQGIADQEVLIGSVPKDQKMQGGEIGQARSLLGEFTKQFNKAKRILAKEKIDIDDVVNMRNITAQVEVMTSNVGQNWEKTTDSIALNLQQLEIKADKIGYEIQKDISEGSPGITQKIRQHWDKTAKFIRDRLLDVKQASSKAGTSIDRNLTGVTGKISERMGIGSFQTARQNIQAIGFGASNFDLKFESVKGEGAEEINQMLDDIAKRANASSYKASRAYKRATKEIAADFQSTAEQIKQFDINKIIDSNSFGRQAKFAFDTIKKIGVDAALKFGALAVGGVLAFKGITAAVASVSRAVGDLFFNTSRNIEAFKNLYSLQLKFKSAGLGRSAGFELAQEQGISFDAVQGQVGITSSLREQLGVKKASEIAAKLSQGLVNKGVQGEDLTGSLTAFSQIGSKGKFQAEESYQLRERLPDIAQLSQSALGTSAAQMEDMQRSGKILAVEYLPAIADELEKVGTGAALPAAELQRAVNNSEKLRASLGEGTLTATRPLLKMFNAIANQGTAVSGMLKGLGIGFIGLAGYGVFSLAKIALGFTMVSGGIAKAIAAMLSFSVTTLPILIGITAGLALFGTTITAISKKSSVTLTLEEMASTAGKLADNLERAGKVEIKPQQDRFGANIEGNLAQRLFSGDMGSRFVDSMSRDWKTKLLGPIGTLLSTKEERGKGGLTRMKEADEDIATADYIQESGRTFSQSLQSPEELLKIVDQIKASKNQLAVKKVELINLGNAKESLDKIQKLNREIGDLSGVISGNKKQITSFIQGYEDLKALMETEEYAKLSPEKKTPFQKLEKDYDKYIDLFRGLQAQIDQKTKFELQFNLAQASIDAAKTDLEMGLAKIDLNILERSLTSDINVTLTGKQERREELQSQLSRNQGAVATQRKELSAIPDDLKASIKSLIGVNLEDATSEQINQALTKLENSAEGAGEDLKAALTKAKELKQNEVDILNKRKEILQLELQIQADSLKRKSTVGQIQAIEPLGQIKATAINQEIELANRRMAGNLSSTAVSVATTKIQFDKAAGELAITNNRLAALNNDVSGFDSATKQWFLNLIGKPTANFAEAIKSLTPEMLQEVRSGFGEEISANPVRETLVGELEKIAQLNEQQGQLRLTQAQNRVSIVESLSGQLFQSLQSLESELVNSDNAFRSQIRSLQDFTLGIEDYNLSLKDSVFNLNKQIKEVQRNITLTQLQGNSAFFDAAGIQNQITEFFGKITGLVDQGSQIALSDRRPELEKELERDQRDYKRKNQQFDRQEEDIKVSTNSQVFQSQQAIARLQREKFTVTDETGAIDSDAVKRLESSMSSRINEANFSTTSFNDYAVRNNSPYRMTDLVFDEPNFSEFAQDPEAMIQAAESINQKLIEINRQRIDYLKRIEAEGLKDVNQLRQETVETFKEQEAAKTKTVELEGQRIAAENEKLAQTIKGTWLSLEKSLKFGVPSIKLESDRLSMGNQDLYGSMFGTRDPQPYLTGRKKAEIQVGEQTLNLEQKKADLTNFLDNAGVFNSPQDFSAKIGKMDFNSELKEEILGKISNATTQEQIKAIIEAYRNQLGVVGDQLDELNRNKDKSIERAGKIAGQRDYLEVRSQKSEVRSQLGGVLKESGKLSMFETANLDRELGKESIELDFESQLLSPEMEKLKTATGGITDEWKAAYKALESLRDIKLDNLIEQTNVLGTTLKDSVGAGFDSFIGTLKSDFGDMDKLWRNTLVSMLEVFANFAAQIAKQELLKGLGNLLNKDSAPAGGASAAGGWAGLIATGIMAALHDGGMVQPNPGIPNFSKGGLLGAIGDAYSRERAAGNQPVLLVAGVGERILNKQQTQEWNAWKSAGVKQQSYVPNMAMGGMVGERINSAVRNYNNSSSNDYSSNDTINISLPQGDRHDPLGRSEERQAISISERVRRAKSRNGF